jgi:hypothetical protein
MFFGILTRLDDTASPDSVAAREQAVKGYAQ